MNDKVPKAEAFAQDANAVQPALGAARPDAAPANERSQPARRKKKTKKAGILIVGMHRSGTSALARMLNLLGCDLPKTLLPAGAGNERGHWESRPILTLNDEILASAGSSWDDWESFNPAWYTSPVKEGFLDRALNVLEDEFGASRFFVLKDPRICRLLPFWIEALRGFGVTPYVISPIRNPREVATSLQQRNGFDPAVGLLLWLRHVLDSEAHSRSLRRAFLRFEATLGCWRSLPDRLERDLGLAWPRRSSMVDNEIDGFLSLAHRHHVEPDAAVSDDPRLSSWIRSSFIIFDRWTRGDVQAGDRDEIDSIRTAFAEATPAFAQALWTYRQAARRNDVLEEELATLRNCSAALEGAVATKDEELVRRDAKLVESQLRIGDLECTVAAREAQLARRDTELMETLLRVGDLESAATAKEAELARREAELMETQLRVGNLEDAAAVKEAELVRRDAELMETQLRVGDLESAAAAKEAELARRDAAVAATRSRVAALEATIAAKDAEVSVLEQTAVARDTRIRAIQRTVSELRGSTSWRVTAPLRGVGLALKRTRYSAVGFPLALGLQALRTWSRAPLREWRISRSIARSDLFDRDWYLNTYTDVAAVGLDPVRHYVAFGAREGRDPGPRFSTRQYLAANPDVVRAGMNPLAHYVIFGALEGRFLHQSMPTVDITDYLPSIRSAPPCSRRTKVDIILPVYRGFDETRRCIESVLADRQRPSGDIIVLDDCSPEPELSRWLKDLAANGSIRLLTNEQNLGFVRTVNRGVRAAWRRHDVVLLNSDTEVPEGWLRRLAAHAHSGPHIGTVTPFSNTATICSYPSLEGGPLPQGHSLAALDAAFFHANAGRTVALPTAVGFAMYIRRDCLDAVGLFDAETFGRGYGEENDFCLRATALGWVHLLACDTFVYHAGEVSFGKKSIFRNRAWDLIVARYPDYPQAVADHIRENKAGPARFAATTALYRFCGRPVILLVCHAAGGGTERHINMLMAQTSGCVEHLILRPIPNGCELSVPAMPGHPTLRLSSGQFDDLAIALRHFGVRRVHIHHVLGYDVDIRRLVHLIGVPFDFTVHDYFAVCPRINLISHATGAYCGEPAEVECNSCIAGTVGIGAYDILSWRWRYRWLFAEADRIICPTQDVQQRLERYGIRNRTFVVPHERVDEKVWSVDAQALRADEPLRIAILGVLAAHKGAAKVRAAAIAASPDLFEFIVIGSSAPALALPQGVPYRETGPYHDADLPRLIAEIRPHVVWFPAVGPETYSYTLDAAISAKLPIVASNLGAFPERLEGHPWLWLESPEATADTWLKIFAAVRNALTKGIPPRPSAMRVATNEFYPDAYLAPALMASLPTIERGAVMRDLRVPGRVAVLVLPEMLDGLMWSPCAYIRLMLPLNRLQERGLVETTVTTAEEADHYRADVIVCQRYPVIELAKADWLIEHARRHGMKLLYDLDDDLLNVPADHPEASVLKQRSEVIERFVRAADTVLASTEPLGRALLPYQPNVIVVENGLDERLLSRHEVCSSARQGLVRILYMGTATHDADLALVEPALLRLMREVGDSVRVEIMGVTAGPDLPTGMTRVGVPEPACHSYPAFLSWLSHQTRWDIGIAPLTNSAFNRSKSAIKALDYMAMGIAAVVSDVPAYRDLPQDAVLRVPNDSTAWFEALSDLARDPERRCRLAIAGQRCLFDRYTLEAQADRRLADWKLAVAESLETGWLAATRVA